MTDASHDVFLKKLRLLHDVSAEEERALVGSISRIESFQPRQEFVSEGDCPTHSTVVLAGLASRVKQLPKGKRQILAFQFPGDVSDLYGYVLKRMDHSLAAITGVKVGRIPHERVAQITRDFPNLAYVLWRDTMVDSSIRNMAVVNLGSRTAEQRLAHFLCEQFYRMAAVGLAELGKPCSFQVTQTDIADTEGLSLVHVNKTLKTLKQRQLIGRDPAMLEILDWDGLTELAGFNPSYLHYRSFDVREARISAGESGSRRAG